MVDAAAQVHVFPVRVYYEDTDAGGVVYYANYLKFAERGRSELLRQHGIDNTGLQQRHGINFAVRDCSVTYHAPARLDESLSVLTDVQSVGAATLSMRQRVARENELLVELSIRLACLNEAGRPARLPSEVRQAFADLIQA
ncbi:MAG: tol-pal system-associated acyl-CoA thioesterase [Alphaproteobacteria bacterium]|nr:tol-pal system-associated acyl-CoA thioesterase [Alphaproteobacteria bacterium]